MNKLFAIFLLALIINSVVTSNSDSTGNFLSQYKYQNRCTEYLSKSLQVIFKICKHAFGENMLFKIAADFADLYYLSKEFEGAC